MKLLLASQSATRQAMLRDAGVPFEVVASPADEDSAKARLLAEGRSPHALAAALAQVKAQAVTSDHLVLGADQILEQADGAVLSKARSREELAAQLRALSGASHQLHSAATLVLAGKPMWAACETVTLTMRPLSDAFIAAYLEQEWTQVRWNVGGYRIEGVGAQLFEQVEGSHFAVLGLPLLPLLAELRRRGLLTS